MAFTRNWETAVSSPDKLEIATISINKAISVFEDSFAITIFDPLHSIDEDLFIDLGYSSKGRLLVVIYTERKNRIRLISCRKATNQEKTSYERY